MSTSCHAANENVLYRRSFLARCLAFAGGVVAVPAFSQQAAMGNADQSEHEQFVTQALSMREMAVRSGDQPYGAIVVKEHKIVGFGPSRVITSQDPTAHAEMEAIRDAAQRLGTRDLSNCTLYSTSRPCRMCETAAYWAQLSTMYFGDVPTIIGEPKYGC